MIIMLLLALCFVAATGKNRQHVGFSAILMLAALLLLVLR